MLNTQNGEIEFSMLGATKTWRMTSREAEWLEAMAAMKLGSKVDFLSHVFNVAAWSTEDYVLACTAGLRFFDRSVKPEDISMSITEMIEFRLLFTQWVSTLIPEDLKKKAALINEQILSQSPKAGSKESK